MARLSILIRPVMAQHRPAIKGGGDLLFDMAAGVLAARLRARGGGYLLVEHDGLPLFQVVGDNLTHAKGLTQGSTRTDTIPGQGTANAIHGRPIFGRNFRVMLSKSW